MTPSLVHLSLISISFPLSLYPHLTSSFHAVSLATRYPFYIPQPFFIPLKYIPASSFTLKSSYKLSFSPLIFLFSFLA
nr:TPA_asm: hypothetical protein [Strongylocentrotus sea urchin adintovirus]